VAKLQPGQEVEALERWASWVRVRFGAGADDVGWVVVQKLGRQPPTETSEEGAAREEDAARGAEGGTFVLKVTADHTMQVRVSCDLVNGRGEKDDRLYREDTPVNFRFRDTVALTCHVRDAQHVESRGLAVELLREGRRIAAARTDAIHSREIRLRSDGPWGPARSQICRARAYVGGQSFPGVMGFAVECRTL
jgi:hypothetical protein